MVAVEGEAELGVCLAGALARFWSYTGQRYRDCSLRSEGISAGTPTAAVAVLDRIER